MLAGVNGILLYGFFGGIASENISGAYNNDVFIILIISFI